MRSKMRILVIIGALWIFGCDFPGILGGDGDTSSDPGRDPAVTSDTLLHVHITGGFAGVNQRLLVRESGAAVFVDSFRGNAEWRVTLSRHEINDLRKLILANGFLLLEEEQYSDPRVADAFFYDIEVFSGEESHRVLTDRFGAPDNLKTVIDGILDLIARITENGLRLELTLSTTEIRQGETVALTLTVTNQLSEPLTLRFDSGQIFDFVAFPHAFGSDDSELIWNWAHDKIFTLQIWQIDLAAGESRSYEVAWDGRDNNGEFVSGEVAVAGELVSTPGGMTARQLLRISE